MDSPQGARLGRLASEVAAHVLAFGLGVFASAKVLRTMFVLPNAAWDTSVGSLGGTFATWAYFGAFPALSLGLAIAEFFIAGLVLWPRTRTLGCLAAAATLSAIVWTDAFLSIVPGMYVALGLVGLCAVPLFRERDRLAQAWRTLAPAATWSRRRRVAAFLVLGASCCVLVPFTLHNHQHKHRLDGAWELLRASEAAPRGWTRLYVELAPRCSVRVGEELAGCTYRDTPDGDIIVSFDVAGDRAAMKEARVRPRLVGSDLLLLDGEFTDVGGRTLPLHLELGRRPVPRRGRPF